MSYLGRGIKDLSDRVVLDSLTASATDTYTLQLNSTNFVPSSAESLTVSLNGIIQKPQDSYTVSSSSIIFASTLSASDSIDFVIAERGITLQTPSAGSVNTEQLANGAVTSAKLASGVVSNQSGFRNIVINGDMSIAQRGTSATGITTNGINTVDRWTCSVASLGTWTQSQSTDVPTGQGFVNSLKLDCTVANASPSSSSALSVNTRFEGQNSQYLNYGTSSAKSLTLSFWVKSNKTGTYTLEFQNHSPATDRINCQTYTIDTANTWEKKTITIDGDTTSGKNFTNDNSLGLWCLWWLGAGSNYNSGTLQSGWGDEVTANRVSSSNVNIADSTSNDWYITGVQLEAGTTASDFEFLPHDVNLERCMRYYQKSYEIDDAPGTATSTGTVGNSGNTSTATTTTQIIETVSLLKPMRAEPTITVYDFAGTSGKVTGIDYGVNEYNNQNGSGFRVGSKHFGVQASSLSNASSSLACHYTASAEI